MLEARVDFVRGEHVVLFGKESRKKNLFTSLDLNVSKGEENAYVGRSWSSYARTIEKQS
jgi:hypothetical protein